MMQMSAPVQKGNSGGPVLNQYGDVVGVVSRKLDIRYDAENVNFAVHGSLLHHFLEKFNLPHELAPRRKGPPLSVAQIVRKAAPSVLMVTCS